MSIDEFMDADAAETDAIDDAILKREDMDREFQLELTKGIMKSNGAKF